MNTRLCLAGAGLSCALCLSSLALADESVYTQDFQSGSAFPEWSTPTSLTSSTNFSRFLGRFTNSTATLTLNLPSTGRDVTTGGPDNPPPPPPPDGNPNGRWEYTLSFDFYAIDSWDGSEPNYGPDFLSISVNSQQIFHESFANTHTGQTYTGLATVLREELGFNAAWVDSIYRITLPLSDVDGLTTISFSAQGLQAINDESWGLDNFSINRTYVPAPAAASLLLFTSAPLLRRRRR